jgi:GT2 family glycosyltransferase
LAQTQPVNQILIVDNASTDGTPEWLQTNDYVDKKIITYHRLASNIGGAGGFKHGLHWAFQQGFEWIWVMDDDSIPKSTALGELLAAYDRFSLTNRPRLLASKAVWVDGSLHPMNRPIPKTKDHESLLMAAQHATLAVRYATFVSLLLHRSAIEQYGLPWADYFIWADDIEYTARILRHELGVVVPSSIVWHKTAKKYTAIDDAGPRYYYHVRNNLWIFARSNAFSRQEKLKNFVRFLIELLSYLIRSRFAWGSLQAVIVGLRDGLLQSPKK